MKIFKVGMLVYLIHIGTVFLTLMMLLPLGEFAADKPIWFSVITVIIYTIFIYNVLWKAGARDARKIKGFYPDKTLPLKVSVFTVIVPLVLLGMRIFAPNLWYVDVPMFRGETDFFIKGMIFSGVPDFLFRLWELPFGAFIPSGNIVLYALSLLYMPIIIFASYHIGLKRFRIVEYLYVKIVFSKNAGDKLRK